MARNRYESMANVSKRDNKKGSSDHIKIMYSDRFFWDIYVSVPACISRHIPFKIRVQYELEENVKQVSRYLNYYNYDIFLETGNFDHLHSLAADLPIDK